MIQTVGKQAHKVSTPIVDRTLTVGGQLSECPIDVVGLVVMHVAQQNQVVGLIVPPSLR